MNFKGVQANRRNKSCMTKLKERYLVKIIGTSLNIFKKIIKQLRNSTILCNAYQNS